MPGGKRNECVREEQKEEKKKKKVHKKNKQVFLFIQAFAYLL